MPPLRLVFLGSDAIARPLLDLLAGDARALVEIVAVFTQPDRPHGRGQKLQAGPIKEWALARGVPVFQPERLGPEDVARLHELRADLALVMAYGQLLKDDFLAAPRLGVFNLHTSLLPKYRGASPATAAIAGGDAETGVTFMRVVRKLDAGAIVDAARVPIGPHDTTGTLEAALGRAAAPLTLRCLEALRAGALASREQDETQVSYCRRLAKMDGVLDFSRPAAELARRVNALMPWPGCTLEIAGTPVKLGLAEAASRPPGVAPGTVLAPEPDALAIAAGDGVLRLLQLQRPGGRMLPAADFLRGFAAPVGAVLASQPMPELVGPVPFPRK
ncbi:MAG TPA: methionyl-tRNA formyltransferase [Opitutaceae bacterium]|nr:methionyl-tRNA formyltransferase [Opitutaceae bacterium]